MRRECRYATDHLRPAEAEPGGGAVLHFPVAAARPLPAAAGSVCAWAGNTIHWGAACRIRDGNGERGSSEERGGGDCGTGEGGGRGRGGGGGGGDLRPRHSVACTFRRRSAPVFCSALAAMTREECAAMDVAARVRLVAQSLVMYSRWYTLPPSLPGL